ncbi:MAG: PqqD family protein [Magnetospirillum sp.]|nr:PqqD family protein [Magnetospirillum sp.]
MTGIGLNHKIRNNPIILATDVDGEVVMMDAERGAYYGLNAIGSDIWNRLSEPMEVADLCRDLALAYDAPAEQIQAETLELLSLLAEKNLVVME